MLFTQSAVEVVNAPIRAPVVKSLTPNDLAPTTATPVAKEQSGQCAKEGVASEKKADKLVAAATLCVTLTLAFTLILLASFLFPKQP